MKYFKNLKQTIEKIDEKQIRDIIRILQKTKGIIYICGNGGSLSNSTHIANDWTRQLNMKVIALDNNAIITAYSNDLFYKYCFSEYLKNLLIEKDILLFLISSGN